MNKSASILLLTLALLSSCARAELDVPGLQTEVSYCVVSVKTPLTKSTYDTAQPFGAWAWYLPAGKTWAKDKTGATPYIGSATSAEEISYSDGQWKSTSRKYYWPKAGSLSFFAYSPYTLPENAGTVSCDQSGISLRDYNIGSQCDFLVADPATDKTAAETTYGLNGVPTLFRHTLSKVTVRATLEKEFTDGKKVTITGITLENLYLTASYKYSTTPQWTAPKTAGAGSQTMPGTPKDISTTNMVEVGSFFVIPQTFGQRDDGVYPEITINYIDEKNEAQTATRNLYELSTKATSFEPGRHYIYTISFGTSDQPIIFGGQSVEDWVVKGSDSIQY